MKKAIAYYRVSRKKQGISGLGLAAQKQAVSAFITLNKYKLLGEFVEVESTRKNKRPKLSDALEACKACNATLLIAKLDRLARSVVFISQLMEAKADFKAVDNPYASKLVVHIMAAFAEYERDMISERTKAALKVAKDKGVELGKYGRSLAINNKLLADKFAEKLKPVFLKLQKSGITTVRDITQELNRLKIPTYRKGGRWHINTVYLMMKRLKHIIRVAEN